MYLTVEDRPLTMPRCPVCFKPLAGKAIGRLFGTKRKERKNKRKQ